MRSAKLTHVKEISYEIASGQIVNRITGAAFNRMGETMKQLVSDLSLCLSSQCWGNGCQLLMGGVYIPKEGSALPSSQELDG